MTQGRRPGINSKISEQWRFSGQLSASCLQDTSESRVIGICEEDECLNNDPIFQEVMETRDQLIEQFKEYYWLESTELAIVDRGFLFNRVFEAEPVHEE